MPNNYESDKAISPVVGIILMIAITVILAAVIGTFVLDLGSDTEKPANAGLDINKNVGEGEMSGTLISASDNLEKVIIEVNGIEVKELNSNDRSFKLEDMEPDDKISFQAVSDTGKKVALSETSEFDPNTDSSGGDSPTISKNVDIDSDDGTITVNSLSGYDHIEVSGPSTFKLQSGDSVTITDNEPGVYDINTVYKGTTAENIQKLAYEQYEVTVTVGYTLTDFSEGGVFDPIDEEMWEVEIITDYSDSDYRTSTPISNFNPEFVQGEASSFLIEDTCQTNFESVDLSESGSSSLENYFCSSDSDSNYDSLNVAHSFYFKSSIEFQDEYCDGTLYGCGMGIDTTNYDDYEPLEGVSEGETVYVPSAADVYYLEEVFKLE